MLRVGLTGGIGSGKSTVAAGFGRRGGLVIDADGVARAVVTPDGPAYPALVERFGTGILLPDGTLDRPALAAVVFADPDALADLNRMTHPAIGAAVLARAEELSASAPADGVIVLDQPLLTRESATFYGVDVIVVVDAPTETAVGRLVAHRGFSEQDARARIAAQVDRATRLALADIVIDNGADADTLDRRVGEAWDDLRARSRAAIPAGG